MQKMLMVINFNKLLALEEIEILLKNHRKRREKLLKRLAHYRINMSKFKRK